MSVLIGMPSGSGQVPMSTVQTLLQMVKPVPCGFLAVERQRVDKARNHLALEAISGGFDHLLMLDDDQTYPPNTLSLLLEAEKDVVIAPILSRNPDAAGKHALCAFYTCGEIEGVPLYEPITSFRDPGPLHQIDVGGTGCMLVARHVLEKLRGEYGETIFEFGNIRFAQKTWLHGVEYERRTMSEDVEFCERANLAGFSVWLDERVRPWHLTGERAVRWGD